MQHGRDHQEREQKLRLKRTRNTPDSHAFETKLATSGRKRGQPPEKLVGPHEARGEGSGAGAVGVVRRPTRGSDPAPTRQAAERERIRHEEERKIGRVAAGTRGGGRRDKRAPGVTREALSRAAKRADEQVGARTGAASRGGQRRGTAGTSTRQPASKKARG